MSLRKWIRVNEMTNIINCGDECMD